MHQSLAFKIIAILAGILALFGDIDCRATHGTCVHQGRQYREGEEWIVNRLFIMRCFVFYNYNRWETRVVGCLSLRGDRIPLNGQIRDSQGIWKCVRDAKGSTKLVQQMQQQQ
ncbi:hypothetical protein niasHT_016364 [Heterodera trifolii]|uniref:Abnormal cell migration protein 18-like fibronectin type I domain-containing protein n=1 Tax=Heterodera trifolii TaxID=157864 RepID=A0ABD2KZ05_9BILA